MTEVIVEFEILKPATSRAGCWKAAVDKNATSNACRAAK
jgi:hypothetical protein